jgi:hypothetical protein
MLALLLTLTIQAAPFPGAVQPDPVNYPTWWVPCSHPEAIARGLGCVEPEPVPDPCLHINPYADPEGAMRCVDGRPRRAFRLGHVYTRPEGQGRIYVAGSGQAPDGTPLLFALCLEAGGDCLFPGAVRALRANADAQGWTEEVTQ